MIRGNSDKTKGDNSMNNYLSDLQDSGGGGLLRDAISAIDSQLGGPFHRKGKKEGKYYARNEEGVNKGNGKGQHSAKGTEMAIEDLWGHHHEVARLGLLGYSKESIAQELGLSAATVQKISKLPAVREKMMALTQERDKEVIPIVERIRALATKAVDRMEEILDSDPDGEDPRLMALKLSTAKDVLDRAGHAPVRKTISVNHHDVSIGQRKSILDGIRERALNRGVIPQEDEADNEEVIDITLIEEGE